MTSILWNTVVIAIQSIETAPSWLQNQGRLDFETIKKLPDLDIANSGDDVSPRIEERVLKADYLDFLREQIALEPRGPEWNKVLKLRLAMLEPHVGRRLINATFFKKPDSVMLQINAETKAVIHWETN